MNLWIGVLIGRPALLANVRAVEMDGAGDDASPRTPPQPGCLKN